MKRLLKTFSWVDSRSKMDMWSEPRIGRIQGVEVFMGGFSTHPTGFSLLAKK